MILIGQFDSPFVRRVAVALELYGLPYEHRPWSTFGDAEKVAAFNPLRRVPTLVLDNGESVIDSFVILDWLDEAVGVDKAMIPASGPERRRALKICALAAGLADKSVALLYERVLHKELSQIWIDRCRAQITAALSVLETELAAKASTGWFGDRIGHADIAVACAIRFTREAHEGLFETSRYPALGRLAETCEGLEAFRRVVQPLDPPKGA